MAGHLLAEQQEISRRARAGRESILGTLSGIGQRAIQKRRLTKAGVDPQLLAIMSPQQIAELEARLRIERARERVRGAEDLRAEERITTTRVRDIDREITRIAPRGIITEGFEDQHERLTREKARLNARLLAIPGQLGAAGAVRGARGPSVFLSPRQLERQREPTRPIRPAPAPPPPVRLPPPLPPRQRTAPPVEAAIEARRRVVQRLGLAPAPTPAAARAKPTPRAKPAAKPPTFGKRFLKNLRELFKQQIRAPFQVPGRERGKRTGGPPPSSIEQRVRF